jgi:predicted dehydrogenase
MNREKEPKVYKSCLLGCGGRAKGHADAYRHVTKGKLEAVCDKDEERLYPFADQYAIPRRYTDLREMLETEEPALLHVVTQPTQRVEFFEAAAACELPAMLVEKPLALDAEDFNAIAEMAEGLKTRVCVNHQLRFHPKLLELLDVVRSGAIGDVLLIDGSARLGLAGQGTHILNLVFAFADARPAEVLGQVSGGETWLGGNHPCPDMALGDIRFEGGVRGIFACGHNGPPASDDDRANFHKRIAVHGTRGFVHWKMESWELYTPESGYQSGQKSYRAEDILGQAAMTDAIFEWLADDSTPHPNRLDVSLAESNTVLGLYRSGLDAAPVQLPFTPAGIVLQELRQRL